MEYTEATTNIGQPRVITGTLQDINGRQEGVYLPLSDLKQVWVQRPDTSVSSWDVPHEIYYGIYVEQCYSAKDPSYRAWAVKCGAWQNDYLTHAGGWETAPMPSDRTDSFYKRCRWPDFGEAMAAAQKAVEKAKEASK